MLFLIMPRSTNTLVSATHTITLKHSSSINQSTVPLGLPRMPLSPPHRRTGRSRGPAGRTSSAPGRTRTAGCTWSVVPGQSHILLHGCATFCILIGSRPAVRTPETLTCFCTACERHGINFEGLVIISARSSSECGKWKITAQELIELLYKILKD